MTFSEYLVSKKIDLTLFKSAEPNRYEEWEHIFGLCGAASFTQQKLFLINDIRRKYKLTAHIEPSEQQKSEEATPKTASIPKPMAFKPKFK